MSECSNSSNYTRCNKASTTVQEQVENPCDLFHAYV